MGIDRAGVEAQDEAQAGAEAGADRLLSHVRALVELDCWFFVDASFLAEALSDDDRAFWQGRFRSECHCEWMVVVVVVVVVVYFFVVDII